jgi:hypothetical protein
MSKSQKRKNKPPAARGTLFVILKRTVIGHWSFVIGEINNTKKPTLIGRGCQPPVPLDPLQKLLIRGNKGACPLVL